jgi:SAM-dependent methyltransferase
VLNFDHRVHATRRIADSTGRAVRRLGWALEDRRLVEEQRRGVLGPAHRQWRPPTDDHRRYWSAYDWSELGEEWTASPEWKHGLIEDILAKWMPEGGAMLEIGPGAGRWSQALLRRAAKLVLVDASERPLELCRDRFTGDERVECILSSGSDLAGIPDGSIDAVWSFDVFVHVAPLDQAAYLKELARVLVSGGVAVIHHADGRNRGRLPSRSGWRSPMSRRLFAALATEHGLQIECQLHSWGPDGRYDLSAYGDAITVLMADTTSTSAATPLLRADTARQSNARDQRVHADR